MNFMEHRQSRQQEEPNNPNRRKVLKWLLGGAATVGVGGLGREVLEAAGDRADRKEQDRREAFAQAKRIEEAKRKALEAAEREKLFEPIEPHEYFDTNPEFFEVVASGGEWADEAFEARRRLLEEGVEVFDDVGGSFYLVQKGDTLSGVREKLSAHEGFEYLLDSTYKLESFNIPSDSLPVGKWIPIPVEAKDRRLTEAQFVNYANQAVDEMRAHELYGGDVEKILKKISHRELVALMFAVAKQEGGGHPLGQFSLHRYEKNVKIRDFSYSHFHVLNHGAGEDARQGLDLTRAQTYHPANGGKLFLAFLAERAGRIKDADRYFPVFTNEDSEDKFARVYNGKRWKKFNEDYMVNIKKYYAEALERLSDDATRWKREQPAEQETQVQ